MTGKIENEARTGGEVGDGTSEPSTSTSAGVTMTLWTRTPVCGSPTSVINRLGRLRATGAIEAFEVRTWPDEIELSTETGSDPVVETFERFEAWAADRGLSVRPGFDVRTVSPLVGRERELLTLPMMCLAVRVDGETGAENTDAAGNGADDLVGVFPCRDGERTWTIGDYLDAYEMDET